MNGPRVSLPWYGNYCLLHVESVYLTCVTKPGLYSFRSFLAGSSLPRKGQLGVRGRGRAESLRTLETRLAAPGGPECLPLLRVHFLFSNQLPPLRGKQAAHCTSLRSPGVCWEKLPLFSCFYFQDNLLTGPSELSCKHSLTPY